MLLRELAMAAPGFIRIVGSPDADVKNLQVDSRKVLEGSLFFCIPGKHFDAHEYAPQAAALGACAVVVEREVDVPCPQVLVRNVRNALSYMAAAFYGHPAKSLKLVGLTGTKGKTTTSYLIKSILEQGGHKVGIIGTTGSLLGTETIPGNLTMPEPIDFQRLLRHMADNGAEYVVMEVSANALVQHRVAGMVFEAAGFTNFSQDHLDYFADMDEYFAAKLLLFGEDMCRKAAYNSDDERVAAAMQGRGFLRCGICTEAEVFAKDIEIGERGCEFLLTVHDRFQEHVSLRLAGIFNVYNSLMAAAICLLLGSSGEEIRKGLEAVTAVPGRIELIESDTPYRIILDYAHSPDSLENILKAIRQTARARVIVLFGCGGDRDHAKRPIMGEIGGRLADYCILTSDNPRGEDPFAILASVEEGILRTECPYTVIENRRAAILYGMRIAQPGDVLVLAGKGHETYQEIRGVKHPFDEKVVVGELLEQLSAGC